jgi:hypothetical protein
MKLAAGLQMAFDRLRQQIPGNLTGLFTFQEHWERDRATNSTVFHGSTFLEKNCLHNIRYRARW